MSTPHPMSIRWRLARLMVVTTAVSLVLLRAFFFAYQYFESRAALGNELSRTADMVGAISTPALQMGDARAAGDTLAALTMDPRVTAATLVDESGRTLAAWSRNPGGAAAAPAPLRVERPVMSEGDRVGTIVLEGNLGSTQARLLSEVVFSFLVLAASLALVIVVSLRLQRSISVPVLHLAEQAGRLAREGNYALRVTKQRDDEIGQLYDRFNEMLDQIQERDAALLRIRDELEARVKERTSDLRLEIVMRRLAEEQVTVAKQAAEAASRAKSAFLANMSHELRTPLNAIIGYSEMLQEDAQALGQAQMADDLSKIERAGKHLMNLIADVLDISKIEAGKMALDLREFDVAAMINAVAATAQPLVDRNLNHLEIGPLDGLGTMTADQTRIQQVLLNLLGNAAKFTEHGRIRIEARRQRIHDEEQIRFRVEDNGIGMSPEQTSRLFTPFMQGDETTTRRYGGTGLGLAISREIIRLMGGDIGVESRLGAGSIFTVAVPAVVQPLASAQAVEHAAAHGVPDTARDVVFAGQQDAP